MPEEPIFTLLEPTFTRPSAMIKIIGVGGGGSNAANQMFQAGLRDVSFAVCNTDAKALSESPVPEKIQLGEGLGAGGNPEMGRKLAEESLSEIHSLFNPEVKMVYITAGMGGGTGTGASPVIAREARKAGILTVGVVTLPFLFEGNRQIDKALMGMEMLAKEVDAIIIINNERVRKIYNTASTLAGFARANEILYKAVKSIVEITFMRGTVNLDFRDISTVLTDGGVAVMSQGYAKGENRITRAIDDALNSPIINNNNIYMASRVVIKITTSPDDAEQVTMEEIGELNAFFAHFRDDLFTKYGIETDPEMHDGVKIVVLASGFGLDDTPQHRNEPTVLTDQEIIRQERRHKYYPEETHTRARRILRHYMFSTDDLDNEMVVEMLDNSPTLKRTQLQLKEIRQYAEPANATTLDLTDPQNL